MTQLFKSRFTPDLDNGQDVYFNIGDVVTYGKNNAICTINSELMTHKLAGGDGTGYEAIFSDTGETMFAQRILITDWEGKDELK